MDIPDFVRSELCNALSQDPHSSVRWRAKLIPIAYWPQIEWSHVQFELERLQSLGMIAEIVTVSGEDHDDDDVVYVYLTDNGRAWLNENVS